MKTTIHRVAVCLFTAIVAAASMPSIAQNTYSLPYVLAAGGSQEGFVGVENNSGSSGTVRITAVDDTGSSFGPATLSLDGRETVYFRSIELERGNISKGLSGGVGDGRGHWRLFLETALDITPLAYIRTSDGFVTAMHDVAPETEAGSRRYRVVFINPAANTRQVSRLRLVNPGATAANVEITGRDDAGDTAPGGTVTLSLPAGGARTLTAQTLENGGEGITGNLGDGAGKWILTVSSNVDIQVMSLLRSPTGHLANLSTAPMHAGMTITIPEEPEPPEPQYVCPAEIGVGTTVVQRTNFGNIRYRILSGGRFLNLDDSTDSGTFTYRRTGLATATTTSTIPGVERCDGEYTCTTMRTGTFRVNCNEFGVGSYVISGTWELQ